MLPEDAKEICRLFAVVLDYPGDAMPEAAAECARRLECSFPKSARAMQDFATFVSSQERGALEEIYTQTFDIAPATAPYLGYHLFGEGAKRSAFMVKLQDAYQAHGFSGNGELPDHLCVLLRFLSVARDPEFVIPLLQDCVLPVLERMEKDKNGQGYSPAVNALRLFLQQVHRELTRSGGLAHG
ncbi:MAG: molecular chaperone TorD family protein [Chloroflexi bacterium]|nr:molecular chaperone TorD family protein [Chloroflexota bacterium]